MITTIRVTSISPSHVRLSIWVNHGLVCDPGGICLRVEELQPFVTLLQPDILELEADEGLRSALDKLNITIGRPSGSDLALAAEKVVDHWNKGDLGDTAELGMRELDHAYKEFVKTHK